MWTPRIAVQLAVLSAAAFVDVTGHFISYMFIVVIIRDLVGVRGPNLAWLLAAFGIAGLISMGVMRGHWIGGRRRWRLGASLRWR